VPTKRVFATMLSLGVLAASGCSLIPTPDDAQRTPATNAKDTVSRALRDVERFWAATYPDVADGARFQPVEGGYHPYTENDPPPSCGGEQGVYQPNAFYCPSGDFIGWDAQSLIPQLQNDYGPLLVGLVMAHEYGHAIQARLGRMREATVVLEQQADCFSGAWLADVLAGRSTAFRDISPAQLDNTVAGVLVLRDQPGTPALAEGAHGNAFDRIRAVQEGVEEGATKCAGYRADNLPVTEIPFETEEERASGGDLPYDDAVRLLAEDAQGYWTRAYPELTGDAWQQLPIEPFEPGSPPSCPAPDASAGGAAFYCPDGDFIAFDNERLGPALHERIGDNAVGMLLGDLFARAAQDRRGASTRDKAGQLAVDCLAGTWTNDLLTRDRSEQRIRLSPGDLDEAVTALLAFGRASEGAGPSAFERIAVYRKGVLQGLDGCTG
jgi:predicted metalloprotease